MNSDELNLNGEKNLNQVCPELEECLSKLRETSIEENEIRKLQNSAVLKIKSICKDVFGYDESLEENMNHIDVLSNRKNLSKQKCQEFYCENKHFSNLNSQKYHCNDISIFGEFENKYHTQDINTNKTNIDERIYDKSCYVQNILENFSFTDNDELNFCELTDETNKNNDIQRLHELKHSIEKLDKYDKELTERINQAFKNKEFCRNTSKSNDENLIKLYELNQSIAKLDKYDEELTKKLNQVLKTKNFYCKVMDNNENKSEKKESWETVTIPKPFQFTTSRKKKNEDLSDKHVSKFQANPIPNHIYKPLYKEIIKKQEIKRKERKEQCNQKLKAMVKPFNFTIKEYKKDKTEWQSMPNLLNISQSKASFKANPIPPFIYDKSLNEKKKDDDEKRKLRIKCRAEKLLNQSASPFSERNRVSRRSQSCSDLRIMPNKELSVKKTNYDDIFKEKTTTVCQPFHFKTAARFLDKMTKRKDEGQISCTACTPPKKIETFVASKPLNPNTSYPYPKKTAATTLRDLYIRKQIEIKKNQMEQELQKLREKLRKEHYFYEEYGWKLKMLDSIPDTKKDIENKVKSNRKSLIQRQCEYKSELRKIQERVHKRPLLIEMQTIISEQNRLEKCYHLALQRAGLDEKFIEELNEKYKDWNNSDLEPDDNSKSTVNTINQDNTSACSDAVLEESSNQNSQPSIMSKESHPNESSPNEDN